MIIFALLLRVKIEISGKTAILDLRRKRRLGMRANDYTVENLLWFRKYFPHVYHQLRNRKPDDTRVRSSITRNMQANVEIYLGDHWHPLYSRYNPEQEADRWAQSLQLDADEVVLVGIGCGYHLKSLLEYYPKVLVHVFEPKEQLLLASLQGGIFFDLPAHRILSIVVSPSDHEKLGQLTAQFFESIINRLLNKKMEILFVPAYNRLFPKEVGLIVDIFKKLTSLYRNNLHVNLGLEKRWTINALKNLAFTLTSPSALVLKERIQGKPLIIASSGPSLEKEVEVLKQYRNHVVILAAGSSVNGLLHQGVLPHAVISFDPAPANKKVFDLLAKYDVQVPFIFGTTIYHEILSEYRFNHLFHVIISQDTVTPYIFRRLGIHPEPVLADSPTIAVVALQLAVLWEANPIIFVGQDLAVPDNKFYAAGVSHSRNPELTEKELENYFSVEKVGGGTVLTSASLNRMRENMEAMLKQFAQAAPHYLFINTSADGARIHGTMEMPLKEALERYGTRDLDVDAWFSMYRYSKGDTGEKKGLECLQQLFAQQSELDVTVKELEFLCQRIQNFNSNSDHLEKMYSRLDQYMKQLVKYELFQIMYKPMMRTQIDIYRRAATQVRQQEETMEKALVVGKRLQAFIKNYYQVRALLAREGFVETI